MAGRRTRPRACCALAVLRAAMLSLPTRPLPPPDPGGDAALGCRPVLSPAAVNPLQLQLEGILRPHRNHQLFSDHFLGQRLPTLSAWRDLDREAAPVLADLQRLYSRRRAVLPRQGEMQLEQDFVRPILGALGHAFQVQAPLATREGTKRPDYVLFESQAAADALAGRTLTEEALRRGGLAVADVKAWGRSLDAPGGSSDSGTMSNPSYQIHFYIQQSGLAWGILTDGRYWRLYHEASAHRLDRYYEVDLPELLEHGRIEDFRYFYAFFRRAAFDQGPLSLESILRQSVEYAQGVGESIKEQVYAALRLVAQGFLDYPRNRLQPTPETLCEVYDNSLVVLYRLLFVLYAEARGLLPLLENQRYREDHSLHALKHDVARRLDEDRGRSVSSALLWAQLQQLFVLIDEGAPPLQVATFNGGLFDPHKHPFLDQYSISDCHLERAVDLIARVSGEFVDYRDLATRHLGTIYEGLLEYHLVALDTPEPDAAGRVFTTGLVNDKGERKSSGSFYTPDYIVEHIVHETLAPVIAEATMGAETDEERAVAVLRLNVLDPAMGSAHFLVEATEYLARYLAGLDLTAAGLDLPAGEVVDVSFWKRRVAQACIYGVDLNPLAVELAKLSLWLTTAAKDRPLSFLDHHLRCGNSLVGATLAQLREAQGPPRRAGRRAQAGGAAQTSFLDTPAFRESMQEAVVSITSIETNPGRTVDDVREQESDYAEMREKLVQRFGRALDLVVAERYGLRVEPAHRRLLLDVTVGRFEVPGVAASTRRVNALRKRLAFFHWELEFPDVFFNTQGEALADAAGFDAVIGNPPYDVLAARERGEPVARVEEFLSYASKDPVLAAVLGRKVDLFRLFLAQSLWLGRPGAVAGFIVPMSLLADQQATTLRAHIFESHAFRSVHAFPQKDDVRRRVFAEAKLPTCVVTFTCHTPEDTPFRVTIHPGRLFEEVAGMFETTPGAIRSADPEALTIPLAASTAANQLKARLFEVPGACKMGDLFTSSQGEINETTMDAILSTDPAHGVKVLRGSNIRRYRFDPDARQGVDKYLDVRAYRTSVGGARVADTEQRRFGYQRNSALDSSRRLLVAELPNPSYCFDSIAYIPIHGAERPYAWLALLNSDLLEWFFRLTSTNNHVSTDQLHKLPALRAGAGTATTPSAVRTALVRRARAAVTTNLADAPSVTEEIVAMLQRRQPHVDAALDVLDVLAREMLIRHREQVEALEAAYLDMQGVLGDSVSKFNRLWTPVRVTSEEQRAKAGAAAEVLGPLAGQIVDFSALGRLDETQWKWVVQQKLRRVPNLSDLVKAFRRHHSTLATLVSQIDATELMINTVVFAAFRVTTEEVAIVEEGIKRPARGSEAGAG